ncbi:hypothetical protein AR158_C351R [Paramecium bursaria Chlorella virus AR158]|uniref:hypothetical protein n=1 Tax=Paramecium bursaria Chlorella virus AR158 TaxID=380598 RepID=UPI00015AA946|nr:hypothetical protein AR158_C351R [Paramecium bursaria Chlorella virus AR158]ABU43896.1 hypothetical protein AR158_C351R [Paramecium bursaria Chlorella virus AR158]
MSMVEWKGSSKSVRRSSSPRQRSPSPRSSPVRSSRSSISYDRARQSNPMSFTPRTKDNLRTREAKVERRRLQAEAKAHKISMRQQQQELRHMKRTQGLEYTAHHKEVHGITPTAKYGIIAGVAALAGYFFLF